MDVSTDVADLFHAVYPRRRLAHRTARLNPGVVPTRSAARAPVGARGRDATNSLFGPLPTPRLRP